jgi:NADP-dependent 3-hydroxy acid dehydrogenase YdfG
MKMMNPEELTVLVTGATSGFGEAICRRYVSEGSRVIATGRRRDRLKKLRRELGPRCQTLCFDVGKRDSVSKALISLPRDFAGVNVVVANAGLALGLQSADKADLDDWDQMVLTNINGVLFTIRAILPGMVQRNQGHVVLMGSVAGDFPYPGGNVYGATKSFIKQLALNLRADLLGTAIRVTNIEPGMAETEFSLVRFKGDKKMAASPYQGLTPLSAEDVAETVYWSTLLPPHININRLQVMPVMQAFAAFAYHRRNKK